MRTVNYKQKTIKLLQLAFQLEPSKTIGQHLVLAFEDYGSFMILSDKAFYENLKDYVDTLQMGNELDDSAFYDDNENY